MKDKTILLERNFKEGRDHTLTFPAKFLRVFLKHTETYTLSAALKTKTGE